MNARSNALVNEENTGSTGAFMRAYVVSRIKPRALSPVFTIIPPLKVCLRSSVGSSTISELKTEHGLVELQAAS